MTIKNKYFLTELENLKIQIDKSPLYIWETLII